MPHYNLTETEANQHLLLHTRGTVTQRKGYCIRCYPATISVVRVPLGYYTFWYWISTQYRANRFTGFTLSCYQLLVQHFHTSTDLDFLANIVLELLQSIQFARITLPLVELSYYIHKLFELTNGFTLYPTGDHI